MTKVNPTGSALLYLTYIGGEQGLGVTSGFSIAIDSNRNVYVAGQTGATDFPTMSAFQPTKPGPSNGINAFMAKLDATGSSLLYSTYLGGTPGDTAFGIAVDRSGHAYVTGVTYSFDFPTTARAFDRSAHVFGGSLLPVVDAFVTKLDPAQAGVASLVYSTYLGGLYGDQGRAIAVDDAGNAYVAGFTYSLDFPTTSNAFQPQLSGTPVTIEDAFITKLDATGSALLYSTYLGGTTFDAAFGIAVDQGGHVYVAGSTNSTDFPTTPGAFQTVKSNPQSFAGDFFVTKLDPAQAGAASLIYSTYLGGSFDEGLGAVAGIAGPPVGGIAVDTFGNAYVTGTTNSLDFPTRHPLQPPPYDGSMIAAPGRNDAFVTVLNLSGSALLFSTYLGGANTLFFPGGGQEFVVGDDVGSASPSIPMARSMSLGSPIRSSSPRPPGPTSSAMLATP